MAGSVLLALLAGATLLTACQRHDRRPGLWLSGEVVEGPVEDWAFTDAHPESVMETRKPWLVVAPGQVRGGRPLPRLRAAGAACLRIPHTGDDPFSVAW